MPISGDEDSRFNELAYVHTDFDTSVRFLTRLFYYPQNSLRKNHHIPGSGAI